MSELHPDKPPSFGMSDQERNNIVLSFIKAFLDEKVSFDPLKPEDLTPELLRATKAQYGEDYTQADPVQLAMILRMELIKRIEIVAGNVEASPQQKKEATNYIFGMITAARMADRMHGQFIGVATYESRLKDAEDRLERLGGLVEDLEFMLRNFYGLSRGPQQP